MATTQELVALGEKMGVKAAELHAFVEKQQAMARDERESERVEKAKIREFEQLERERDREVEKERHQLQDKDKDRELERMKLDIERKKLDAITIAKQQEESNDHQGQEDEEEEEETVATIRNIKMRGPKLASFDETKDDMDSYIHRYEQYARLQGWKKETWASSVIERKGTRRVC